MEFNDFGDLYVFTIVTILTVGVKCSLAMDLNKKGRAWIPDFFPWIYFSLSQQKHRYIQDRPRRYERLPTMYAGCALANTRPHQG